METNQPALIFSRPLPRLPPPDTGAILKEKNNIVIPEFSVRRGLRPGTMPRGKYPESPAQAGSPSQLSKRCEAEFRRTNNTLTSPPILAESPCGRRRPTARASPLQTPRLQSRAGHTDSHGAASASPQYIESDAGFHAAKPGAPAVRLPARRAECGRY